MTQRKLWGIFKTSGVALSLGVAAFPSFASDTVTGVEVKAAIVAHLSGEGIIAEPQVSERRRYYGCASALTVSPKFAGSWETAKVTCPDKGREWSIMVRTGQVIADLPGTEATEDARPDIVALLASVKKGAVITDDIVALIPAGPGSRLGGFYRTEDVVGRRATQNISAMQPLKARHLEHDWTVEEGQPVQIVQIVGGFRVSSIGEVLENGQIGDIISVENARSGKKISALVESSKKVSPVANMN